MNTQMVAMNDLEKMAAAMAKSGLFGVKNSDQALALMLVAQAQGISPATACVDFDIINGKPAMTARAMLARFQQAGGVIKWIEYTEDACEAEFSHTQCPTPIKIRWTMKDAVRAGIAGKDNYKKYPRQMLSSRVMSEGVDRCYPAASGGFYPPEVVQDFGREKDITPMSGAGESLNPEDQLKVNEVVAKVVEWMNSGSVADACQEIENAGFPADEMIFFWSHLDSKMRSAIKKERERQRLAPPVTVAQPESSNTDLPAGEEPKSSAVAAAPKISDAARKRLEARITELGLDREMVKKYASDVFKVEHFADLSRENYDALDKHIEIMATDQAPKQKLITDEEALILDARCQEHGIDVARLRKAAKVDRLAQIKAADLAKAHGWIDAAIAKMKPVEA